ncbi:MAG: carboxypeptidase regulatory-like domain-containing protein, partial [Terriglobia bacterium]
QGGLVRWNPNTPIRFEINPGGVPNFTAEQQRFVVLGAVNDAFRAWTEIPDAAVVFSGGGISSEVNGAIDGTNVVSFQGSFSFPPGVLGVALVASAPAPGPVQVGNQVVVAEFAGQILDADILFNPNPTNTFFSPVGANNSVDIVAVGLHEAGHFLGLDHTGVFSSIMNPFSESGSGVASRTLQTDDTSTIASLYPAATFAPSRGSISGIVTNSTGGPVKSASIVAFSTTGGVPVASQLSGADGRYSIDGLPPGSYHVLVEPFDGPITLADFPGFYANGSFSFATTFLGGPSSFAPVSVAAGQTATANITLLDRTPSILNIETLGTSTQVGGGTAFLFGPGSLYLPRGKSYQIFVTGQNLTSDSNLTVFGTGITGGATTGGALPGGQPIRQQTLDISASATLRPSNLHLSNSGSTSVFAGGIVTTVNPTIGLPLRDTAGFGAAISPGALIAIFGSDLAFGNGPGGVAFAVAKPL